MMRRGTGGSWYWGWATALSLGLATAAVGVEPVTPAPLSAESVGEAERYVTAALKAEAEGNFLERQKFLQSAAGCVKDFPRLRWQQGFLHEGEGKWLTIDECVDRLSANPALAEYEQRRLKLADNLDSHLAMAAWCRQNGLLQQSRSHYERVIQFDTDHVPARLALGYQLVGGEWISPQQIESMLERSEQMQASLATYGKQLQAIARDLGDVRPARREAAQDALFAITERESIPAVESVLAGAEPAVALMVVKWMQGQDNVEASHVLLRYATLHMQAAVREAATQALKDRPLYDFVPQLLEMLAAPMVSQTMPVFNSDGTLAGYRQAFAQEGHTRGNVFVIDTNVRRVDRILYRDDPDEPREAGQWQLASPAATPENRLVEEALRNVAQLETQTRAALVQQRNQAIALSNSRVADFLSTITGREFTGNANQIWNWWDEINETEYQASKPSRYRRQQLEHAVPRYHAASYEAAPPSAETPRVSTGPTAPRSQLQWGGVRGIGECFVAGTPVLTTRGLKPIDSIVAGDTVFCRDTETGELLIKPVLQATMRPPAPTMLVEVDGEQLGCTSGHLFWVSGSGWKKASELLAGDVLHSATHPALVTSTEASVTAATYNLQVADSGNFFVGKSRILSHDVMPRRPTHQVVPGLETDR